MWNVILEIHCLKKENCKYKIYCCELCKIILTEILGDIGICSIQICNLSDIWIFIVTA